MSSREQDNAPQQSPNQSPDKAMDGLLRRSLARSARSQDCPAPDILAAYFDRSLDAEETARYELHFSTCAHCRAQLAAMVRAGEPEAAKKHASGWGWLANRWWFVPSMAAAALGLLISVTLVRKIYQPVSAQQVALNAPPPAPAPASGPARDSLTSQDAQLLDRTREKAAPPAAPTAIPEKKSKDLRLVAPRSDLAAKLQAPPSLAKTQRAQGAPAAADSLTSDAELDASAPAPRPVPKPAAPTRASGARAASGFNAQNQVQQQNQRPLEQQYQQQNESTVQSQSPALEQRQVQAEEQAASVSGGVAGGVVKAPQSDSKELAETARAHAANGKFVSRSDSAIVQNAKQSSILKVYPSPDTDAWWRLPGAGVVEFSPNAGESWHRQLVDKNAQFLVGAAPGKRVFWIAGREGVIYLTTNGTSWKKITPPANADFVAISARDARSASVTASDRRVFTTEDGGETWNSAP